MSTAEALAKASSKQLKTLNTVLDSEGREVVVEEREDAEAKDKLQETVDLLVAAGEIWCQGPVRTHKDSCGP